MLTQQQVIDAWADMKDWVENTLTNKAKNHSIQDISNSINSLGSCNSLNDNPSSPNSWSNDGKVTFNTIGLKITEFSGVKIKPASFFTVPPITPTTGIPPVVPSIDDQLVALGFSFEKIELKGNYSFSEPCAYKVFGSIKTGSMDVNGVGNITQTIQNGEMYYIAAVTDKLSLINVGLSKNPTIDVHVIGTTFEDEIRKYFASISATARESMILSNVQNAFKDAAFSNEMINLINEK